MSFLPFLPLFPSPPQDFSMQKSFFQELLSVIIWCISHPLVLTDPCLLSTVRAAMTGCICLEDTGACCTQFMPDKPQFGPTGSLPVPARSRWFNQFFTTHQWTEEGSAVWPNLSVCHKRKFLLRLEIFSVVFQGRFQLHSCFAGMGIWDRAGCRRWARVGQESLQWRSLLRNKWHHFILLPPGRSKYCSVTTSCKPPSRCHRDKVLCSGYTCLLLVLLSLERAQTACAHFGDCSWKPFS